MDFSSIFIRKDKKKYLAFSDPTMVKPKGRELAIAEINQPPILEQSFDDNPLEGLIEVTEITSQFPPGVEDAAILYANGRIEEAANLLRMFLQQKPEEDQLWFVLFDLYGSTGQQAAFEQLALDYTLKCEKSPPAWIEQVTTQPLPLISKAGMTIASGQLFSLKGLLDHNQTDRIQLLQNASSGGAIQLDLSGIDAATPAGCDVLQRALHTLQKQNVRLQIASGTLISLLQRYITQGDHQAAEYWLLLLQLFQLQGKQTEFEDVAVDYAVMFEVSPPSWVAPSQPAQVVALHDMQPAMPSTTDNVYILHGVLSAKSVEVFNAFKIFASQCTEVKLDMSYVERIEFSSVSVLMDALIAISAQHKQVTIVHSNLLNYVLMVVMGIDQIAKLEKPVRK